MPPLSRKRENMKTSASLFTGGDGWGIAARAAGYRSIWGIECVSAIADVAEANGSFNVIRDYVQNVDPSTLEKPDLLCASPVCKSFSVGNPKGEESPLDILCAEAVARFLRVLEPPEFIMENVAAYAASRSMDIIRGALQDVYGWHVEGVFNAADYGVPQTRKRFIVRANGGYVAPPKKSPRRIGWYEAIEDLIPTLPPSAFADWQLARLSPEILETMLVGEDSKLTTVCGSEPSQTVVSSHRSLNGRAFLVGGANTSETQAAPGVGVSSQDEPTRVVATNSASWRAFLVDGKPLNYEGELCVKQSCEAVPTVTASQEEHPFRAWLEQGRVVKMTHRALARFQSFPDWYEFPTGKGTGSLCCTIIGNAVAPVFGKAMIETL